MKLKYIITIAFAALFIAGCACQKGPLCRTPHSTSHPVHVYSK